jgi:hypothetical protein
MAAAPAIIAAALSASTPPASPSSSGMSLIVAPDDLN